MNKLLKDLVFQNWALKVVSIFLALFVWILLVPQDKLLSEKTLTIPLEARNIPTGLEIVDMPAIAIDVVVRAPNRILGQITPAVVTAALDLERATVYQQEFPLNKGMVSVPLGAEVVNITPNKVSIKLERTKEALLEVRPNIRGRVAPGYRLAKWEVEPSEVTVHGPESRIRVKDLVTTAPVDVSGLTQSTVFEVDLILPKPELRLMSIQTTARVTITVEKDAGNGNSVSAKRK